MIRFAAALALLALSGCVSCEPLLEVRHCLEDKCEGSDDAVFVDWSDELAAQWPDVAALMARAEEGKHIHTQWTRENEQAFWNAFGVEGDEPEVIFRDGDERFRVRVLTCD